MSALTSVFSGGRGEQAAGEYEIRHGDYRFDGQLLDVPINEPEDEPVPTRARCPVRFHSMEFHEELF